MTWKTLNFYAVHFSWTFLGLNILEHFSWTFNFCIATVSKYLCKVNNKDNRTMSIDVILVSFTARKMKFFIKDLFSKCDQICRKLRIWSHLPQKSLTENLIFCPAFSIVVSIYFCHGRMHMLLRSLFSWKS